MTLKRIVNPEISMIGGVGAGIAYALGLPSWLVRGVMIILLVPFSVFSVFIYLLAWMFLPKLFVTEENFEKRTNLLKKEINLETNTFQENNQAQKDNSAQLAEINKDADQTNTH